MTRAGMQGITEVRKYSSDLIKADRQKITIFGFVVTLPPASLTRADNVYLLSELSQIISNNADVVDS